MKHRWTTISRNERAISVDGRHYFAMRCNPSKPWMIEELDQATINGARQIGVIADGLTTRDVTAYFKEPRI